jgi:hypothetical protein
MALTDDPDSFFEDWEAIAAALNSSISIKEVAGAVPELISAFKMYCPLKTASTFGALTTQKRLQGNAVRLETLVHLSIASCEGKRAPTQQLLVQGFTAVGGVCGCLEDVPEDVFTARIYSKRGNYQILEGLWESGTFYLQRFVNLADGLPDDPEFQSTADSIHALLRLSDAVCERAGLHCNEIGAISPEAHLSSKLSVESAQLRKLVRFTESDLVQLGIDPVDLIPFGFDPTYKAELCNQVVSHSELEAKPLAFDGEYTYLLLPTAVLILPPYNQTQPVA